MIDRIYATIDGIGGRVAALVAMAILAAAAFEGWQLVLRKPHAEYRRTQAAVAALVAARDSAAARRVRIEGLEAELASLSSRLAQSVSPARADTERAAALMSALDAAASRQGAVLLGVRPAGRRGVVGLEELSFDVAVRGPYLAVCRWLMSVSAEAAGARIAGFEMRAAEGGATVAANAKIVVYAQAAKGDR